MPPAPAKPKVSLIMRAVEMGGIQTGIGALTHSRLAEKYEFSVVTPDEAWRQLRTAGPRILMFKEPCSWRGVPTLAAFRLRKGRSKIVIHEHHYSEHFVRCTVPSPARFHAMLRLSYAMADRVLAISHGQADWMLAHRLVPPSRLALVVQASPLSPLLALPPRPPARPLVLGALGRFHRQKGFDVLVEAMRLLPRGKARLLLAGGGPDEAMLRALGAGLDDVVFTGPRTDIAGFFAECDAVVIPSRWEPFGRVCQEAKAAGKPVIVSGVDGLSEQVDGCGLLVAPEDPAALAAAIAQLCESPDETLRAWGARGRANVARAVEDYLRAMDQFFTELTP